MEDRIPGTRQAVIGSLADLLADLAGGLRAVAAYPPAYCRLLALVWGDLIWAAWRQRHLLPLRLRAWWIVRIRREFHPVAELIVRGEWAAVDRLLAELEGGGPCAGAR